MLGHAVFMDGLCEGWPGRRVLELGTAGEQLVVAFGAYIDPWCTRDRRQQLQWHILLYINLCISLKVKVLYGGGCFNIGFVGGQTLLRFSNAVKMDGYIKFKISVNEDLHSLRVSWTMVPRGKKRKTADENRGFKEEWTESFTFIANVKGLPACLLCSEKMSNNKKGQLERHGMLNVQLTTHLWVREKVQLQYFWRRSGQHLQTPLLWFCCKPRDNKAWKSFTDSDYMKDSFIHHCIIIEVCILFTWEGLKLQGAYYAHYPFCFCFYQILKIKITP